MIEALLWEDRLAPHFCKGLQEFWSTKSVSPENWELQKVYLQDLRPARPRDPEITQTHDLTTSFHQKDIRQQ